MNYMHLCLWKTLSQDCPHVKIRHSYVFWIFIRDISMIMCKSWFSIRIQDRGNKICSYLGPRHKKKFDKTNTVARAQHTERWCRCAVGRGAPSFTWNSSLSVLQLVLEPLTVGYVTFTKLLNICYKKCPVFFPDTFITNSVQFILTTIVLVR